MKLLLNWKKTRKQPVNPLTVSDLTSRILLFCILAASLNSYSAPTLNQCRNRWALTNVTPGMQFGDFAIGLGSGTITLNSGSSRTAGGTVDLVSAGSAVNSHQISVNNTQDPGCAIYGIVLDWQRDPASRPLTGPGSAIPISNVMVYIPGQTGSPFTLPTPTLYLDPMSLPLTIEVTAQIDTAAPQTGGLYQSSRSYRMQISQGGTTTRGSRSSAEAFAITPLTLTPGIAIDFGQISSGSMGGTIILNAVSGARTVGSGDADVVNNAIAGTPGTFTVQGNAGLSFNISYVNGSLTDSAGGNAITISGFTDTSSGMALTGGADSFSVGATLTLPGSQPAGNYSTANPGGIPYSVTVNYN